MSKYIRHFLEDDLSTTPHFGAATDLSIGYSTSTGLQVATTATPFTSRYLGDRFLPWLPGISPLFKVRDGWSLKALQADATTGADVELRFAFEVTSTFDTNSSPCAALRAAGSTVNYSGYFADFRVGSNVVAIVSCNGSPTDNDLATAAFAFAQNTVYEAVFSVKGNVLTLYVWLGGTPQPSTPTLQVTNSEKLTPGFAFVGAVTGTVLGNPLQMKYWFLCGGTAGDASPPRPKTYQEYLDFLSTQDALMCMLIEAELLGQTSAGASNVETLTASNHSFSSKAVDWPHQNICFEPILLQGPKIARKLKQRGGRATITAGDFIIKNEVLNADTAVLAEDLRGRLDRWLSLNVDGRNLRVLLGSPSWRRCDFKTYHVGTLKEIYRAGYGQLGFKLRGIDQAFDQPITTELVGGTGPNANAAVPVALPGSFNVSPILYNDQTLTYIIDKYNSAFEGNTTVPGTPDPGFFNHDVRDSGVSLMKSGSITAIGPNLNSYTGSVLTSPAHGLMVNADWCGQGSLPTGLFVGVKYLVESVPTPDTFTLKTIPDMNPVTVSGVAGGTWRAGNFNYDYSTGFLKLLSNPAGMITADVFSTNQTPQQVISTLMLLAVGHVQGSALLGILPFAYQSYTPDRGTTVNRYVCGWYVQRTSLGKTIDDVTSAFGQSLCWAREGTWYLYQLDKPSGVARWTLVKDDVRNWRAGSYTLPSTVERLGYQPNYTQQRGGDIAGSITSVLTRDLYSRPYTLAGYTPVESGLDQPTNHLLHDEPPERATQIVLQGDAQSEMTRLYALYRKPTRTVIFDTNAWALAAELGDEVAIPYPRDGFAYTKNVIIFGSNEDALRGKVELEVFFQVDEVWPVSDLPWLDASYYDVPLPYYLLLESGSKLLLEDGSSRFLEEVS